MTPYPLISRMVAIETRYVGATNTKCSRIIASVPQNKLRIVRSYDHALNSDRNHANAAEALADKMGWKGQLVGGSLKRGYAWVFAA